LDCTCALESVSQFMVVNGQPFEASRKVEFFDMENPHSTCKLQDFPIKLEDSTAAFTGTEAVVCGGGGSKGKAQKSCYQLMENGTFIELQEQSLKIARNYAASVVTPSGDMWVIGGIDYSTELISFSGDSEVKNKFEESQPTLDVLLSFHCVAKLNATTAILTGGANVSSYENSTYFLDLVDFKITPGPPMNQKRGFHGCGTFAFNGKNITVVAGGWDGSRLDSTEYLELDGANPTWQEGPRLPMKMNAFQMVSATMDGITTLFTIGGRDENYFFIFFIFRLECLGSGIVASSCTWEPYEKLGYQVPRWSHAVIPLSDNFAHKICNTVCHAEEDTSCLICRDGYFSNTTFMDSVTCQSCPCPDKPGYTCDAYSNVQEGKVAGQCYCKSNVEGQDCDKCKPNHWNLFKGNPLGCQPCYCSTEGYISCDQTNGCVCKENVTDQKCDKCKPNHWNLSEANPDGCESCECSEIGFIKCDSKSGKCSCKQNVGGQKCDSCKPQHWNFTQEGCQSCDCSEYGSTSMDCDQVTGLCDCKANVIGDKCDQCQGHVGKLSQLEDYDKCLEEMKQEQSKAIVQKIVIISCCLLLALFIIGILIWKCAIVPNLYRLYNIPLFACFFSQDNEDPDSKVVVINFDYDCQMDETRKVTQQIENKLRNGHNSRRYRVTTNYLMLAAGTIEFRLEEVLDQCTKIILVVTKEALDLALQCDLVAKQFDMTFRVFGNFEKYSKLIVVLSDPTVLDQLEVQYERLARYIKNHSSLMFEEPHFWDHLFYQLPHKKMISTSDNEDIELENLM